MAAEPGLTDGEGQQEGISVVYVDDYEELCELTAEGLSGFLNSLSEHYRRPVAGHTADCNYLELQCRGAGCVERLLSNVSN